VLAVVCEDGSVLVEERPDPIPGPRDVLVRVFASGMNNADIAQAQGGYPAPPGAPPDIPGLELCGGIISVGSAVSRFGLGDTVMALVGGGAHAELAVAHEELCTRMVPRTPCVTGSGGWRVYQPNTTTVNRW
jgi:NADPH2:quinone reductase